MYFLGDHIAYIWILNKYILQIQTVRFEIWKLQQIPYTIFNWFNKWNTPLNIIKIKKKIKTLDMKTIHPLVGHNFLCKSKLGQSKANTGTMLSLWDSQTLS